MTEDRLDPDQLLKTIRSREEKVAQLRVFLGMSAGVGKTYAMLRAAHQRLLEGVKVVIGAVETHGRSETAALLEGMPVIDRKKINYRGADLEEMDLEEILRRKPELVIVDELAHTNIPGSRHEKRFQDVIEILDAGIDVYTALNVQHLESRKDAVEAITEIPIRETVPDSILERATLVELVDIAPSELLRRLKEGKVYLGDKAARAQENFFREDKLTALREIALRMTAERVDQDLQRFQDTRYRSPWQTNERLLVAISHSPSSEKLIRATRRFAYNLEAPWIALHIDTGITLNDRDQIQLAKNLNLARDLKAEVITTTGSDIPEAVRRVCHRKNVTQVLVGRPMRRVFRDLIEGGSLLDHLVKDCPDLDVHVIRMDGTRPLRRPSLLTEISHYRSKTSPLKYWNTLCFIAGIGLLSALLEPLVGYRAVGFLFLLAVIIVGMFGSIGVVIFSAFLSAFVWNFFFIPPKMTMAIRASDDFLLCIAFFVVACITGFLTNRIRSHERIIREREERTNNLYLILKDIAESQDKAEFLTKVVERTGRLLDANCGILLKNPKGELNFAARESYSLNLDERDQAVALWSFQNKKAAGWSTETLSQSRALFVPLKGLEECVGVFVFQPRKRARRLDLEKENLLMSILGQLASSIEKHFLGKRIAETLRLKDSEELHQTLLNSISHEIRTPLTAILGSAFALEDKAKVSEAGYVQSISHHLREACERLNRVIENLLDMSRLNSGVLALDLAWQDIHDLFGVITQKSASVMTTHQLSMELPDVLPLLKIDFRLMEHAISNLILNAGLYTPAGSKIVIRVQIVDNELFLTVQDDGPGIADESIPFIFEKFYRVPGSPTGGTGLGLSIAKSIVELHKGSLNAENVDPHGMRLTIRLPIEIQPDQPVEKESDSS